MRRYIFDFEQERILKLGLKLNEVLLLDYMFQFFQSSMIKYIVKDDLTYYRLTYKKILDDLPILDIKERQLRNIISKLEHNKILTRLSHNTKEMFVHIFFDKLVGNFLPTKNVEPAIDGKLAGNKLPTIENYNINNNLIINCNNIPRDVDINNFNKTLHTRLKSTFSSVTYSSFFEDIMLENIHDNNLIFATTHSRRIKESFLDKFREIVNSSLNQI